MTPTGCAVHRFVATLEPRNIARRFSPLLLASLISPLAQADSAETAAEKASESQPALESQPESIWATEIGHGFRHSAQNFTFSLGGNYGIARDWENENHHLAMVAFSYGRVLSPVLGADRWYAGNFECRAELFSGGQFSPRDEWFIGLTPYLRYTFAPGGPLVPFVELGAGFTATSIGGPDLGGTFQFNERAGLGTHWFVRQNLAWTGEFFYIHWSNGGIREPNSGLDGLTALLGLTLFF